MLVLVDVLGHANMDTTAHYAQVAVDRLKTMHAAFHPAEGGELASSEHVGSQADLDGPFEEVC